MLLNVIHDSATIAAIHGPAGSGKGDLIASVMKEEDRLAFKLVIWPNQVLYLRLTYRPTITIDCARIMGAGSDAASIQELAKQTGYRPYFSFLSSLNNMIDLASVGLIGQKGKPN